MLSEFRNRLRQQPIKAVATPPVESKKQGEPDKVMMAWEHVTPSELYETKSHQTLEALDDLGQVAERHSGLDRPVDLMA